MEIRKSTEADFEQIMKIYRYARKFMAEHGNPRQWGNNNWPPEKLIRQDILKRKGYVCVHEGRVVGNFFFDFGKDIEPTYHTIKGGAWLDDDPRLAYEKTASDALV